MLQGRDHDAFSKAYLKFQRPILKYVMGKLRDRAMAEEVTQDIFLKAYRAGDSFDPAYEFSTWLWTIARNTLADWFRKNRQMLMLEIDTSTLAVNLELLPSREEGPEDAMAKISRQATLWHLMERLTELQREVLFMRLLHQLTYGEIARNLRMSLSAVKCLAHRAKDKLTRGGHAAAILE